MESENLEQDNLPASEAGSNNNFKTLRQLLGNLIHDQGPKLRGKIGNVHSSQTQLFQESQWAFA